MKLRRPILVLLLLILTLTGCRNKNQESEQAPERRPSKGEPAAAAGKNAPEQAEPSTSLLDQLRFCETRHRGLFIDTGSSWSNSHRSFDPGPFDTNELRRRAGTTTAALSQRKRQYDFWLDRNTSGVHIALRVQGESSSIVTLTLDGKRVGERRLKKGQSKVFNFGPLERELAPGRHRLLLRFNRRRKGQQPFALVDWLRIYLPDNQQNHFVPPTARNLVQDVAVGGKPRRSLALRAPASIRCPLMPRKGTRLKLDVGYWGQGDGVLRVSARLGHGQSVVLAERKVVGGKDSEWLPLDLTLDAFTDRLIALEFAALQGKGSGRVVFGEPRLTLATQAPPQKRPQNVVVVLNAGLSRRIIPPWGAKAGLSTLFQLTQQAITFEGYRTATTLSSSVAATLLTAQRPSQHLVTDSSSALSSRVPLITDSLRRVSAQSAFFTNVPYTFDAFGFDRGWTDFKQTSPVADQPGAAPLLQAKQWLEERINANPTEQRLLVVHVAGGHPPWDVSKEELKTLLPPDYDGVVDPRRGALALRKVRNRRTASRRHLGPNDWIRLEALQRLSLSKQDQALGSIIDLLKNQDQWDNTLFIWMGDVGMGDAPAVPFLPAGALSEGRLTPPLIVKFAPPLKPGTHSHANVTTADVARTLHHAFDSPLPKALRGGDLRSAALDTYSPARTGTLSSVGARYYYQLERYRLSAALGDVPRLCDVRVDPACQTDLYADKPFLMKWLWRLALAEFEREHLAITEVEPVDAKINRSTRAALSVFGL